MINWANQMVRSGLISGQQPRCKRVRFDPCFHVLRSLGETWPNFWVDTSQAIHWRVSARYHIWPSAPFVDTKPDLEINVSERENIIVNVVKWLHAFITKPNQAEVCWSFCFCCWIEVALDYMKIMKIAQIARSFGHCQSQKKSSL